MGIKWLDKSHRSPVSCKEISREQVANRSQSQCKQGFTLCLLVSSADNLGKKFGPTSGRQVDLSGLIMVQTV